MDTCGANPGCQGFQFCFLTPGLAGTAAGRIRLKGALNISDAIYNPYCRSASRAPLSVPCGPATSTVPVLEACCL